jgi:demethylmenaquinone methyltransferase/2-methoxy-6-polyprenyl-1,4-benzoquinol methylase
MDSDRAAIDEQIAYYRARAAEYDATSMPDGDPFAESGARIRDALRAFGARGRVLEVAAGTGQWTGLLADAADELTVTDASPEMLELNRARTGERSHVRYVVADAFSLAPTHDRDAVVMGFFLSHVARSRFEAFWRVVEGVLAPGGRVFVIDEADHGLWDEDWIDRDADLVRRRLSDGTAHRAIKVLWRPGDLAERLARLGWDASVHADGPFYWADARRTPAPG